MNGENVQITSEKIEGSVPLSQAQREYKEAIDIFPALHKYKNEHTSENLQKLCVEISDFCRAIYVSTKNDVEKKIYFSMLEKLLKK